MQAIKRILLKLTIGLLLVAALFCSGLNRSAAYAAPCTANTFRDVWAKTGTATLYTGGPTVTIWGYSLTASGAATLPGSVLQVNQGDCVQVTLHNTLAESSAMLFQGQSLIPDTTGASAGGTKVYTFAASKAGTFLYEAGLIPGKQHQVAMGLYGALIVQPTVPPAVNVEKPLVLSEFDATLAASPIGYDMRKYAPRYFLINGKAYPDTDLPANQITAAAGNTVLLRYVNAGLQAHAMSSLGVTQKAIATDGSAFVHPHSMVAETIAPGQTLDALVSIPASATTGTKYALYDANLLLRNSNASGLGGMLTFLTVSSGSGGSGPDTSGPILSSLTLTPNPSNGAVPIALSFTANDTTTGGNTVNAAEYWVDGGAHNPISIGSPATAVTLNASIGAGLSHGTHVVSVRAQDSVGNWSTTANINLVVDSMAPTTSGLSLTPNPSNGSVSVTFIFTGNDSASGNSNITNAEYWIDAGAPQPVAIASPAPVKTLTVNLAPPFSVGTHTISARTQDALGNWSTAASINLVVEQTGPTTSGVSASPSSNNGSTPLNTSTPAVRVSASFSDVGTGNSNIAAAEGFIDTVGTTGTGFVFVATDGTFNSLSETGYADVPLAVINSLSDGNHTIYVHSKDAAGNWGANSTLTYLIDRTAPTFTSIALAPNPTLGATTVTLTVNGAADPLVSGLASGVAGGEYWINPPTTTAPAPGSGTPFNGPTASIPVGSLTPGTYTVSARIRDTAGNWSTGANGIRSATLTVVPDAIFSNGFETGGRPWGWSSASTITTSRLNVTTSPALVGTRSLQAQGNNTNYVQYNFGTTAQPATATFDARFYFRPNGNTSTGKDIFAAATSSGFGTQLFHVRYRLNGSTPQVQIQVGNTANATWINVLGGTSNNYIEVVWQSGTSLQLYVNGSLAQTLAAGSGSVGAVRLGSVTNTGNATLMYFDAFVSKRSVSPLIGP